MKIRSFTLKCDDPDEAGMIAANLIDFGLWVEYEFTGCDTYCQFIVSDKALNLEQIEEIYECPPNGHDWSDCKWGDVQCKYQIGEENK